jgi:glutamate-1-semialdehyde 2,1-aminomutase
VNWARDGLKRAVARHGLPLKLEGHPAITSITFDHPQNAALGTLMTVRMLDHDILAGSRFYATLAHRDEHVQRYVGAADIVFAGLAAAIAADDIESRIGGPVRSSGFARLT